MASLSSSGGRLFFLGLATAASGFDTDIVSDIVAPQADERRALEIKSSQFWQSIQQAAKDTKIDEHQAVYEKLETAIEAVPIENKRVKGMLGEALVRLRRADEKVLLQMLQNRELATERLVSGPSQDNMFSFLAEGQNFFSHMVKRFIGGGQYSERVAEQLASRHADVLPALRGSKSAVSDVLTDCRVAQTLCLDVLKFDVYNDGVPVTSTSTVNIANTLIEAAQETRRQFLRIVRGSAEAIAKDTQEEDANPSAIVTKTLLPQLSRFGSKLEEQGSGDGILREVAAASKEKLVLAF